MNEKQNQQKTVFNAKNIMRLLALACIIFVFCPTFLVSCSGQDIKVSVMTAVGGISAYGEKVIEPHPIMLICLALPVAILVLLFVKKFTEKVITVSVMMCGLADTIIWFVFRTAVKKVAEENGCTFKTTAWFVINIIVLLLIVGLSILVLIKKIELETDLMTKSVVTNMGTKKNQVEIIGYCEKCGGGIEDGFKFCTSCGTAVPETMIAEAEEKRLEEEQIKREEENQADSKSKESERQENVENNTNFCKKCEAKLEADAVFCVNCGAKIE